MLRLLLTRLIVVALLLMSVEGAIDSVGSGVNPQGDEHAYHLDGDDHHNFGEQSNDPCGHCCHAHAGCVTAQATTLAHTTIDAPLHYYPPRWLSLLLAPPTPPPNV